MKRIVFILFLAVLSSCGGRNGSKGEESREELAIRAARQDSLLNDVFSSLNEISANLTEIKDREGIVTASASSEIGKERRARIFEDIAAIDELLKQNRLALDRLQGTTEQLRRSNIQVRELETLVAGFARQIREKDADIETLRRELESMQIRVTGLNAAVDSLQTGIDLIDSDRGSLAVKLDMQDDLIHTVRYIVGRERELIDKGIVKKSGFIGRTLKLNSGYDREQLTRVDSRNFDRIVVGQRWAEIVTSHPADSYRLIAGNDNVLSEIEITDPERFWETSKVLVVSYK